MSFQDKKKCSQSCTVFPRKLGQTQHTEFVLGNHTLQAQPTDWLVICWQIDLSRIPVNSRHVWTKHSDLYEIVYPILVLISLCLLNRA